MTMPSNASVIASLDVVPTGRWGVAVSGGADSVALLRLAMRHSRLQLHVIHLDHETRGGASGHDAEFVRTLAGAFSLPLSSARRSHIEDAAPSSPDTLGMGSGGGYSNYRIGIQIRNREHPTVPEPVGHRQRGKERNPSARYRLARLGWFGVVVQRFDLSGVLLAHHADDQAETVAQRLLRGRQPGGLCGMAGDSYVEGVRLLRPLLNISTAELRAFLRAIDQPWVEDASNRSAAYQRNRLRQTIREDLPLRTALLDLGGASGRLAGWLDRSSPTLAKTFDAGELATAPPPLARHAAARWLRECGMPPADVSPTVCDRLIALAADFAGPSRADFPGAITVQRTRGRIVAQPIRTKSSQQFGPIGVIKDVSGSHHPMGSAYNAATQDEGLTE